MYLGGKRRWMHLVVETQRRLSFSFSGGGGEGGELKNSFEICYYDIRGFKSCN